MLTPELLKELVEASLVRRPAVPEPDLEARAQSLRAIGLRVVPNPQPRALGRATVVSLRCRGNGAQSPR